MPNPANPSDHTDLVEISEASLPPGTTFHQRWIVAASPEDPNAPRSRFFSEPRRTEPVILEDKTYMTPEGLERRETTILHPPTLEDMSGYGGPVLPIHFAENGAVQEGAVRMLSGETRKVEEALVEAPGPLAVNPKTVTESMQERREGSAIPQQFVPDRTSSKRHRWSRTVEELEMHGGDDRGGPVQQQQQQPQPQLQPQPEEHKEVKGHVEREQQHTGNQHVMETKKMPSMLDV